VVTDRLQFLFTLTGMAAGRWPHWDSARHVSRTLPADLLPVCAPGAATFGGFFLVGSHQEVGSRRVVAPGAVPPWGGTRVAPRVLRWWSSPSGHSRSRRR
jgi:hypothetical protein